MFHLALDTSSSTPLVALLREAEVRFEWAGPRGTQHSETLLAGVQAGLEHEGVKLSDVKLISVGVGPGAFTGLRVGIVMAKFLADSINAPVSPVSSLHALLQAWSGPGLPKTEKVWALGDAKRHEVYALGLAPEKIGFDCEPPITDELALSPEALLEQLGQSDLLIGEGAENFREIWPAGRLGLIEGEIPKLKASAIGQIGLWKHKNQKSCSALSIEARYISSGKF